MSEFAWTGNSTDMCYEDFTSGDKWCGERSNCTGILLPFVFEETW